MSVEVVDVERIDVAVEVADDVVEVRDVVTVTEVSLVSLAQSSLDRDRDEEAKASAWQAQ